MNVLLLFSESASSTTSTPDYISAILALSGVVLGALVASIATWRSASVSAAASFEAKKYRQRLIAYQKLWTSTQTLRVNPDPDDLSSDSMKSVIYKLDSWYFEVGGLLLTDEARDAYWKLLDSLHEAASQELPKITDEQYRSVHSCAMRLRDITAREVRGKTKTKFFTEVGDTTPHRPEI